MQKSGLFYGWLIFLCAYSTFSLCSYQGLPAASLISYLSCYKLSCYFLGNTVNFFRLISFPSGLIPEVGWLSDMADVFLVFWGHSVLSSVMVVPIYLPSDNELGCVFLYTLLICLYIHKLYMLDFVNDSHSDLQWGPSTHSFERPQWKSSSPSVEC